MIKLQGNKIDHMILNRSHDPQYPGMGIPYSGKFLEINIFGNYNKTHKIISEIKFWNFVYACQGLGL